MKSASPILAALALVTASAFAQTKPANPAPETPRVELFLGYSYLRAIPTYATGNRLVTMNGGSASIAYNFTRYLGVVGDFGGFADTDLNLTGPGVPVPHIVGSGGKAFTYLAGPRLSLRGNRFTPFAQVLGGAIHASPVVIDPEICLGCTPLPAQTSFALTAGAGLDITLTHHLALRAIQAEYLMTRFPDPTSKASNTQNDLRLSSGLVLRLGGSPAPLPLSYTCSASPATGYPGDPILITGSALSLSPKHPATYTWTTTGGTISGTTSSATIDTAPASPGAYVAQGHVSQGLKPWQSANCSAPYTVLAYQPPTIACFASPATVLSGESVNVSAQAASPQNRPLTYTYATSAGSIAGTTSTATLTTSGLAPGVVTVTCTAMDDKNQSVSATATLSVTAPPQPVAVLTQNLCSVSFTRDKRRPVRVDNEAKACLDDIALNLQRTTDSKVALIGHSEIPGDTAGQRASNTRDYLVKDKGIDPTRIVLYTGSPDSKTVDAILIPAGAKLDTTTLTPR